MRTKITTNKSTQDVPAFTQEEVKQEGKVYTPDVITTDLVNRFIYFQEPVRLVCDPSCGQGNFLRTLYRVRFPQVGSPDDTFEALWGFELDPQAVETARQYFIDQGVSKSLVRRNIIRGDALEVYLNYLEYFDDVLGNPPYVRNFKAFPFGIVLRDNLADAFFQIGMEILKSGNDHHLVYITQDSFITNEESSLRRYLLQYNLKTVEHHFDYSKAFRRHDIAVDIGLIEVAKGKQEPEVNVSRHVPFQLSSDQFGDDKWLIYPEPVRLLATKLAAFGVPLSSQCSVKKGRTVNADAGVPNSYGRTTYSKSPDDTFTVPVLAEPNTGYFFPVDLDPVVFAKDTGRRSDELFEPFIALPYFTSKFRFCLIEEDLLTTPLLYVLSGPDAKALLPLLNSSVVDFIIRYTTKSRDTGYEFKASTFDNIRVPKLDTKIIQTLEHVVEFVRKGEMSLEESDHYVCTALYGLDEEELELIRECKQFWFKKNVKTLMADANFIASLTVSTESSQ